MILCHSKLLKIFLEIKVVIFNKQVQLQTQFDKNVQSKETLSDDYYFRIYLMHLTIKTANGEEICPRHFEV